MVEEMEGKMSQAVLLNQETLALLDDLAERTSSSRNEVIEAAIASYDAYDRWFRDQVEQSIKEADEGKLIPHEVVKQRMEALLQKLKSRQ